MPEKYRPSAVAAALFALNAFLCWRLFFIEHIIHFGSIEPAFFGFAKAIRERWPSSLFDPGWWAQSNAGMPFSYTYQPLFHHLVAGVAGLANWSEARAYHFVLGIFYALGPVTLFALGMRLTRNLRASLTLGLLYSLVSPSAFLIPNIAVDMGGAWFARRLHTATVWGDGPNVAGLTLVPLAILFLNRALERRTLGAWFWAAVVIVSVPLTNVPAAIALVLALVAYALASDVRSWFRVSWGIAAASLAGCALFAFWISPSALRLAADNSQWMSPEARFDSANLPYYALLPAIILLLRLAMSKLTFHLRFAVLFAVITTGVVVPSARLGFHYFAQAHRLHLAMEMGVLLAAVLIGEALLHKFKPAAPWPRALLTGALTIFCIVQIGQYRAFAKSTLREGDIKDRAEFKIARWMEANAGTDRVFVPGAVAFWFNYLARQPQLTGCCDQNQLMPIIPVAHYVLGTDDGAGDHAAEISTTWLQVFGVHYVAVTGPLSNEPYKDFRHPEKFKGVLKEVWREGDDVIYEVPLPSPSLAHVVNPDEVVTKLPINGIDMEPLAKYRAAILDSSRPQVEFTWINDREANIRGTVPAGNLISLQIPYHSGWHSDSLVTLSRDALGLMVINPLCSGYCAVHLRFDGGLGPVVSLFAWLALGIALAWSRLRRAPQSDKLKDS